MEEKSRGRSIVAACGAAPVACGGAVAVSTAVVLTYEYWRDISSLWNGIVYSDQRQLPTGVPGVAPDGSVVNPAPEGRGLPSKGEKNTWVVGPRNDRRYGPNGQPLKDVDWAHDHGKGRPHVHDWIDGERTIGRPPTDDELFSGPGRLPDGAIKF